ncbi:hypothetical protein L207DRAFT_591348 [Hyaloscypha variabilis F]|uniref:Uncharacterized protein n=1 Tax=Hyaloscypha variabilis (strain UAMH 11265 / GT02V1 / F) TaxID=1149755 RepID=A0A2J6R078_HYAVF|nr:hypothetical protein L207DRAFT_591348 [Hyaloscypha variabilis F]
MKYCGPYLSASEVYEQVAQLVQGLGDNAVLNAAAADLEMYYIDVEHQNQPVPLDKVVHDKAEELERLVVEEAEAERQRERLLQEKQQEEQQLAEAEARQQHMLLVRRWRLLMKQQLEAAMAHYHAQGFH